MKVNANCILREFRADDSEATPVDCHFVANRNLLRNRIVRSGNRHPCGVHEPAILQRIVAGVRCPIRQKVLLSVGTNDRHLAQHIVEVGGEIVSQLHTMVATSIPAKDSVRMLQNLCIAGVSVLACSPDSVFVFWKLVILASNALFLEFRSKQINESLWLLS